MATARQPHRAALAALRQVNLLQCKTRTIALRESGEKESCLLCFPHALNRPAGHPTQTEKQEHVPRALPQGHGAGRHCRHRRCLWRHRHQPALRAEGNLQRAPPYPRHPGQHLRHPVDGVLVDHDAGHRKVRQRDHARRQPRRRRLAGPAVADHRKVAQPGGDLSSRCWGSSPRPCSTATA